MLLFLLLVLGLVLDMFDSKELGRLQTYVGAERTTTRHGQSGGGHGVLLCQDGLCGDSGGLSLAVQGAVMDSSP